MKKEPTGAEPDSHRYQAAERGSLIHSIHKSGSDAILWVLLDSKRGSISRDSRTTNATVGKEHRDRLSEPKPQLLTKVESPNPL